MGVMISISGAIAGRIKSKQFGHFLPPSVQQWLLHQLI
jgi:hypothetical protein